MSCEDILRRLTEDEASLGEAEREAMCAHLDACPSCRRERLLLDESWDMLGAWEDVEPPSDFSASVLARVRSDAACEPFREALVESNGEALPPVRTHLESCDRCSDEARDLAGAWQMLGAWPDLEPSADFTQRVMQKVERSPRLVASGAAEAPPQARRRWLSPRLARTVATLAAGLMMVVGVFTMMQPSTPQAPPVLDQYVKTFDAGRPAAVIEELPVYVAEGDNVLDDLKEPPLNSKADDDAIEEILDAHHHGEG